MIEGDVRVQGINLPVDIIRSQHGVPIIKANMAEDAYFALGYAHAQDRLWQMDMQRRAASGRLSELFGARTLGFDKFMRSLNLTDLAAEDYKNLEIKEAILSYTNGINAYMQKNSGAMGLEFTLLMYEPDPWKPEDSLLIGRALGLMLSNNFYEELEALKLSKVLNPQRLSEYYESNAVFVPPMGFSNTASKLEQNVLPFMQRGASNAWAVSDRILAATPTATPQSQSTYLASDPHLGLSLPSFWYLAKLRAPEFKLAGATVPGMPYFMVGHNRTIAWGMTTSFIDTQDLVVEQINTNNPDQYYMADGFSDFKYRTETIKVRWSDNVQVRIRETVHGPVISDVFEEPDNLNLQSDKEVLTLKSSALARENTTASAIQGMNWAETIEEFRTAMNGFQLPSQNITYADNLGNIGLQSSGKVPARTSPPGFAPQQGWVTDKLWPADIPAANLPQIYNPASGIVLNANNQVADESYPYDLTAHYLPSYRAERLRDLLANSKQITKQTMEDLQMDVTSYMAKDLLPVMLQALPSNEAMNEIQGQALSILQDWDYVMGKEQAAPAIFMVWLKQLTTNLTHDELAEYASTQSKLKPYFIKNIMTKHVHWCDNTDTPTRESCNDIALKSYQDSTHTLVNLFGTDPSNWQWGDFHQAVFTHQLFDKIPFIDALLHPRFAHDGSAHTLNRSDFDLQSDQPFTQVHGAGLRAIFDLKDLESSQFIITPGQSGNIYSKNYIDMIPLWLQGQYITLNENAGKFKELSRGKLTLRP